MEQNEIYGRLTFCMMESRKNPLPASKHDPDYTKIFARRIRLTRKKAELLAQLNQIYPK
jgi:hypothetical protein